MNHATRGFVALALIGLLPTGSRAMDFPEIRQRGTLRVLVGVDELPEMFSFTAGTEPGFEREMLEGFARLHRLKCEMIPVQNARQRIPALLRGEGDLIEGLIDTDDRRKQIDFVTEVIPASHVLVNHAPKPPLAAIEQFREERVGLFAGTSWAQAVQDSGVPKSHQEVFDSLDALLVALVGGKVGATVMSIPDAILAKKRYPGLQVGIVLGSPLRGSWGLRKKDTALKKAIDEYLVNLKKSSSYSRLIVKYFGNDAIVVLGRSQK